MKYKLRYKMIGQRTWSDIRIYHSKDLLQTAMTNFLDGGFMVKIVPINA